MATRLYNPNNKEHQKLFEKFKFQCSGLHSSHEMPAFQLDEECEDMDLLLISIATNELGFEEGEPDSSSISVRIVNNDPDELKVLIAYHFTEQVSGKKYSDYFKLSGQVLVWDGEDGNEIVLDIDPASIDYSNEKEYYNGK